MEWRVFLSTESEASHYVDRNFGLFDRPKFKCITSSLWFCNREIDQKIVVRNLSRIKS